MSYFFSLVSSTTIHIQNSTSKISRKITTGYLLEDTKRDPDADDWYRNQRDAFFLTVKGVRIDNEAILTREFLARLQAEDQTEDQESTSPYGDCYFYGDILYEWRDRPFSQEAFLHTVDASNRVVTVQYIYHPDILIVNGELRLRALPNAQVGKVAIKGWKMEPWMLFLREDLGDVDTLIQWKRWAAGHGRFYSEVTLGTFPHC